MVKNFKKTMDGNEAVARVAYKMSDVFTIYPITPSSPMGEIADRYSASNETNIFGLKPSVTEMQSEGGAVGALHGALQTGSLATTFTCSQGLLLMIPNMYKIAGELLPCVFHIAARSLANQGLSIFGDHQDVMAIRQTGFAMLSSGNVQEAQDMALIAHLSSLESRIPFVHFFDGFRTSHEINKIELLEDETIRKMIDERYIIAQRKRGLNPEKPEMSGTAQNPDVYFQGRETVNKFYDILPIIVQKYFDKFERETGRKYNLFDYFGDFNAEFVVVIMGSAVEAVKETVDVLNSNNLKVGVLQVRLFKPFATEMFSKMLPKSVKKIAVLDRTKESGSLGEPLYEDVISALKEQKREDIKVIGGRYGLSSKEFTPAMIYAIFEELRKDNSKQHFTVGIEDDVTNLSLNFKNNFKIENKDIKEAIFFGLGSDGTVGANKNTIKIICDRDEYYGQAYFVYDSKKSGSMTESHLRFGKHPINSTYLIQNADFIGCHQFNFIYKVDIVSRIKNEGILLINTHYGKDEIWDKLPKVIQQTILDRNVKLYIIDAYEVADKANMGVRINTIMQTCFFKLFKVIDFDEAMMEIKNAIVSSYGRKGQDIVDNNMKAVDYALSYLYEVKYPKKITSSIEFENKIPTDAPDFVKSFTAKLIVGKGEEIKVSEMSIDGRFPTDTTKYEKRNVADKVAVWLPEKCVECGQCVFACPHSCLESKIYSKDELKNAPSCFRVKNEISDKTDEKKYTIQISAEDCTGCGLCSIVCPVKAIEMKPKQEVFSELKNNFKFFNKLPETDVKNPNNIKDLQFRESLFKYSGACAGCGETPYLSLITKLFGDRMLVANATGCSSIYGGNLPTTPWSKNKDGRGPVWSNSLFEDNAEYGFGMRLTQDTQRNEVIDLLNKLKTLIGETLVDEIISCCMKSDDVSIEQQRNRINEVRNKISSNDSIDAKLLDSMLDVMVPRSVWIIGGDGWAYDIGFGGLDHILASGKNVNVMVLDTEVYSNTGGQASKATNIGASAKFATNGKTTFKKDLGAMFMMYNNIYVAQVAIRANPTQTLKAIKEAESYDGPSIIIGYSSCIAHGVPLEKSFIQQRMAVDSGLWMLYRYDPRLIDSNKAPLQIDSKEPNINLLEDYLYAETRYSYIKKINPEFATQSINMLKEYISRRWKKYSLMVENNL